MSTADAVPERDAIDAALARRLIAAQFPQWAHLPIRPVAVSGWDNRTFHLGDTMTVRLPSAAGYAAQVEKEHRWLPELAPKLPLPIPVPLAMGQPTGEYPWRWSIYRWLEGKPVATGAIADTTRFAIDLAGFLNALYRIDPTGGPPAGPHNFWRGGSLEVYDGETRRALDALAGRVDATAAMEVWESALSTSWARDPVWVHGDVAVGNLLLRGGELGAVIDFGSSGVGDPACDLVIAWTLFEGESREAFCAALPLDAGTWARGRAWALWKALITAAGHADTNAPEAQRSLQTIDAVLADHRRLAASGDR
jgi:aminoglycoside phosphotransferase (APT) family kinase protein